MSKLHLGAGDNILDGWINTDIVTEFNNTQYLDVTQQFPFPDNSMEVVFSEHLIEHLEVIDAEKMLCECFRVLDKSGVLRIATPNLSALTVLFNSNIELTSIQQEYLDWITKKYIWDPSEYHIFSSAPCYVLNNAMRNWGHKFLYDYDTLRDILIKNGFRNIVKCNVGTSYRGLSGLEGHGKIIGNEQINSYETMVLEAIKP